MAKQGKHKIIRDSIHGNIKIDGLFFALIELPEFQRLQWIKQLGFTHLVYPGANHTRLEHSLGTFYVARKMAETLGLVKEEKRVVLIAALLHDVGHGPFSHTLEYLLHRLVKKDHREIGKDIILGTKKIEDFDSGPSVKEVLESYGEDPEEIAAIILGDSKKQYLSQIISGAIDADQIDYLLRDAYYTGVAFGVIDFNRLMQVLCLYNNQIMIKRKGVSAIENILVARALMYSSVYLHKTVRISELMIARAVERAPQFPFSNLVDSELLEKLKKIGTLQKEIVLRLKYRQLFKKAYVKSYSNLTDYEKNKLECLSSNLIEKENEIADKIGAKKGHVIIDIPSHEILLSEPRLKLTDLTLIKNTHELDKLSNVSPFPSALKSRSTIDWAVMVCTPEEHAEKAGKQTEDILFG